MNSSLSVTLFFNVQIPKNKTKQKPYFTLNRRTHCKGVRGQRPRPSLGRRPTSRTKVQWCQGPRGTGSGTGTERYGPGTSEDSNNRSEVRTPHSVDSGPFTPVQSDRTKPRVHLISPTLTSGPRPRPLWGTSHWRGRRKGPLGSDVPSLSTGSEPGTVLDPSWRRPVAGDLPS